MIDRLLPLGRLLLLLLTTTVIVVAFSGVPFTHAAAARTCVSAQVPSPFRLPDGGLHPAGTLTVCRARAYSPAADLHLISVDRHPMGLFLGRSGRGEAVAAAAPEIVFRRDGRGQLELLGYTTPTRGRSLVHRLSVPSLGVAEGAEEGWEGIPVLAALAR